jgi:hypothetical protein
MRWHIRIIVGWLLDLIFRQVLRTELMPRSIELLDRQTVLLGELQCKCIDLDGIRNGVHEEFLEFGVDGLQFAHIIDAHSKEYSH